MQSANGSHHEPADDALQAMLQDGTAYRDEDAVVMQQDGSKIPIAYSAAPIIVEGQVTGAVVAFRDMTEVRRLQRMQEEHLAMISHDLRAPLSVIMGHTQLLLKRLTQQGMDHAANSAKIVFESSHRMNDMIEDLLEGSRLESGQDTIHLQAIDLVQLTRRIIDQNVPPTQRNQIQLEGVVTLPVVIDTAQIERVISNLLTNALKFSAPESPVVVQVDRDGNRALVSIADQGSGIASQDLPHLFEKHYRARARGAPGRRQRPGIIHQPLDRGSAWWPAVGREYG